MNRKINNDYSKGKIYCIKHKDDSNSEIYIGCTTKSLDHRLTVHKYYFNASKKNEKIYKLSAFKLFEKYGISNLEIKLLEEVNASSLKSMREREAYFIKTLECINHNIPLQTRHEYYMKNKLKSNIKL